MRKRKLIARLTLGVMLPVFFLVMLLAAFNVYTIHYYNKQLLYEMKTTVELYANNVADNQKEAERFLSDLTSRGTEFVSLQSQVSSIQCHLLLYEEMNLCRSFLDTSSLMSVAMLYSRPNDTLRYFFENEDGDSEELKAFLLEKLRDKPTWILQEDWACFQSTAGRTFLLKICGWRGSYVMLGLDLADIPRPTEIEKRLHPGETDKLADEGLTLFFRGAEEVLNEKEFCAQHDIRFTPDADGYARIGENGHFNIVGAPLYRSDVVMCVMKPRGGALNQLTGIQKALLAVSLVSILTLPFLDLFQIRKYVTAPLRKLVGRIEAIRDEESVENLAPAADYGSTEFNYVAEAFEEMLTRVKTLRIQKYEGDLKNQRTTLEYLKLQIKPHYFINCLKTIFALVESKSYDKVQDMLIMVSDNMRYTFSSSMTLVRLEDELNFVRNYLQIQALGLGREISCEPQVDPAALDVMVPPLVIQTFIENSVKYANDGTRLLHIDLTANLLQTENGGFLDISIADNGRGYPEEILETFRDQDELEDVDLGGHIGISNTLWRLRCIYGGRADYVIENIQGAYAELMLPVDGKGGAD